MEAARNSKQAAQEAEQQSNGNENCTPTSLVPHTSANANQIPNPVTTHFRCLCTWGLMIMYLDKWEG